MTLYVTYPISNSYTTTWYPSPNTRIYSITMAQFAIVWLTVSFVSVSSIPLHYIKIRPPSLLRERPTIPRIDAASPYIITRIPTPLIDSYCSTFCHVLLRFLHYYAEEAGLFVWCTVDPIEADVISFTKIHGQPCFYIDPLSIPRPQAMGETALVILEATSPTTEKLSWLSSFERVTQRNLLKLVSCHTKLLRK